MIDNQTFARIIKLPKLMFYAVVEQRKRLVVENA